MDGGRSGMFICVSPKADALECRNVVSVVANSNSREAA